MRCPAWQHRRMRLTRTETINLPLMPLMAGALIGITVTIVSLRGVGGKTDEWLGFAGSAVGALVAVWAAVWAGQVEARRKQRADEQVVAELLEDARHKRLQSFTATSSKNPMTSTKNRAAIC